MKKVVALALVCMLMAGLPLSKVHAGAVCDVSVWVSERIVDLTYQQIAEFNQTNVLDVTINAQITGVSESEVSSYLSSDELPPCDIFCFPQDQLTSLVQGGYLNRLGTSASTAVAADNAAGAVRAAKIADATYAFPLTADNGYFMYYDKSVIPQKDIGSLEALIADCEAADRLFCFELTTSAWYMVSLFFATGCVSEWSVGDNGDFEGFNDTFNSPEGLIAAKGMKKLVNSSAFVSSSSGAMFAEGAAVVVSGTWDRNTISGILGDNMGVAALPSFTVDGETYHLSSYLGCKLMGITPQKDPDRASVLQALAQYLSGEKCQLERFETCSWGPSNLNAQAAEEVQSNPTLSALAEQAAYSVPQGSIYGGWWDVAAQLSISVKDAQNDEEVMAALETYGETLAQNFGNTGTDENAWTVVGSMEGTDWTVDFPMYRDASVWISCEPFWMEEGTQFVVRQSMNWDVFYPEDVYQVQRTGAYFVLFDEASYELTLLDLTEIFNTVILPENTVTVSEEAFANTAMQVLVIPDGCAAIEENAFAGCCQLLYVIIPSDIGEVAADAFDDDQIIKYMWK